MASINSLPAPLPLYIIKLLPDLKALDALRRSSTLFAAVFELHAGEILEHLMASTLHCDTILEIRAHVLCLADRSTWGQNANAVDDFQAAAETPLSKDVPFEAVSLALRTFSYLHSLCRKVAVEKLSELYALPHERPKKSPSVVEDWESLVGVPFEVPAPSPLHWVEEQRILRALFQLRTCALLGISPPVLLILNPPDKRTFASYSPTRECSVMFGDHMHLIRHTSLAPQREWHSPATRTFRKGDIKSFSVGTENREVQRSSEGWRLFHTRCCVIDAETLSKSDWPVLQKLGLGIWSHRRLAEELGLAELSAPLRRLLEHEGVRSRRDRSVGGHQLVAAWSNLYKAKKGLLDIKPTASLPD